MLGFRQSMSPEQRRNWWGRQIARQRSTNVPVAEFCRQLGVPTSTFYEWRRRLEQAPPASSQPAPLKQPAPNRICSQRASAVPASFVPVSILDPAADFQLEIELTNACAVRVKGAIDASWLEAAIAAAAQLRGPGPGGC
jgi:transposase-like protein